MTVFIVLACVGFMFVLISAMFGGDHDVAHSDVADTGHDDMVHAGPSPFSLRVISVFITTFGAAGAIAMRIGCVWWTSTVIGAFSGLVTGGLALFMLKWSYGQQATSSVDANEMVGAVGQVKTAIPVAGVGQVSVVVKSQRFYPIARSKGGEEIEEGATVKIVQYLGDMVIVERVQT